MWQRKTLTLNGAASGVMCSVLAVSPWTPGAGKKEDSGMYLSPENAVSWATAKLAGAPANLDVTALLFSAPTLAEFIRSLSSLAAIFPLPDITALYRRASSAASLADTRMQIPVASGGLPAAAPLAVSTLRSAATIAATVGAGAPGGADLVSGLQAFRTQRAAALNAAREALDDLTGRSLDVYATSSVKNTAGAIADMREDIPHPGNVLTLCIVLAGDDLSAFRGMLHDGN